MERENARMVENEEQLAEKRLKLDYRDLRLDKVCGETWDRLLSQETVSQQDLRSGVSVGIPQARRGEAWQLLVSRSDSSQLAEHMLSAHSQLIRVPGHTEQHTPTRTSHPQNSVPAS